MYQKVSSYFFQRELPLFLIVDINVWALAYGLILTVLPAYRKFKKTARVFSPFYYKP